MFKGCIVVLSRRTYVLMGRTVVLYDCIVVLKRRTIIPSSHTVVPSYLKGRTVVLHGSYHRVQLGGTAQGLRHRPVPIISPSVDLTRQPLEYFHWG